MFVAVQVEDRQAFGPFDSEDEGLTWVYARDGVVKVLTDRPPVWLVIEVEFIESPDMGYCDVCGSVHDNGSQIDHCAECGNCWEHCSCQPKRTVEANKPEPEYDPFDHYGTPEHEAWLVEMERRGDYQ
jgi:hypothetical protein